MPDNVTILRCKESLVLTKVFAEDTVKPYDRAKFFEVQSQQVNDIRGLSSLLKKLETKPRCCVIRGDFKGHAFAKNVEGALDGKHVARKAQLFDDNPKHFLMIDIDGFVPDGISPVKDAIGSIDQFIEKYLPPEFQGVTMHWQLSSSAGTPGKEHILKCHLWYWLKKPYTSPELTAWAKDVNKQLGVTALDVAPLRVVQVHYTANPLFKDESVDPIKVRSGLFEGWLGDEVDLVIDDVVLLQADQFRGESEDYEFIDPSEKQGVIGAFHRAYSVEEVIEDILPDHFIFEDGSEHRLTWLNGGGTPGGAFVTKDRMHVGSTHNTDPFDNRVVNLFDLCRQYLYGHLDKGMDLFEMLDMRDRPSYQAMVAFALGLDRVQAEMAEAQVEQVSEVIVSASSIVNQINSAESEEALLTAVLPAVFADIEALTFGRSKVEAALQSKLLAITQHRYPIAEVRLMINSVRPAQAPATRGLPGWAMPYVYVSQQPAIFNPETKEWFNKDSFDFCHNCDIGVDADGYQLSAYDAVKNSPLFRVVSEARFDPLQDDFFEYDGKECVNLYSHAAVPAAKPKAEWTEADHEAVALAEEHLMMLCSDRREVCNDLIDFLSFNVTHPGVKMPFCWLLIGEEGDGKSWIQDLMAAVMGNKNVKAVNGSEILNPTFNGWAEGACLAFIEEVRIHGHRKDAWDNLKAPLANNTLSITRKGKESYNIANRTNYVVFSNHGDAVPIDFGSRRVGVIHTQSYGDKTWTTTALEDIVALKGFDSAADYFNKLYSIPEGHAGALREWLETWAVSEHFNPRGRAPQTTDRSRMIDSNVSDEEEAVRDAIEEGCFCVCKEVVSPKHLRTLLLLKYEIDMPAEKISYRLRQLGYHKYPRQVKVTGEVLRLWVHPSVAIEGVGEEPKDNEKIRELIESTAEKEEASLKTS